MSNQPFQSTFRLRSEASSDSDDDSWVSRTWFREATMSESEERMILEQYMARVRALGRTPKEETERMQASGDTAKEETESKPYQKSDKRAVHLLQKELNDHMYMKSDGGFSAGLLGLLDESDLFKWRVAIFGPLDTIYEGGFFEAIMSFPQDYPFSPPTVKFLTDVWHPNVYSDGTVCIFPPRDGPDGSELVSECWTPAYKVESIFLCIVSLLASPNDESPVNVEAAKMWRDQRDEFDKKVLACVRRSHKSLYSTTTGPSAMPTNVATSFQNFVDKKRRRILSRKGAEYQTLQETAFARRKSLRRRTCRGPVPADCTIELNGVHALGQQEKESKQIAKE